MSHVSDLCVVEFWVVRYEACMLIWLCVYCKICMLSWLSRVLQVTELRCSQRCSTAHVRNFAQQRDSVVEKSQGEAVFYSFTLGLLAQ